jgi:hypothetical protein
MGEPTWSDLEDEDDSEMDGDHEDENGQKKQRKALEFHLEHPGHIKRYVNLGLPVHPIPDSLGRVCKKFLLWAIDKSANWLDQPTMTQKPGAMIVNPDNSTRGNHLPGGLKGASVKAWINQQLKYWEMLPNRMFVVFPYYNYKEAWLAYKNDVATDDTFAAYRDPNKDVVSQLAGRDWFRRHWRRFNYGAKKQKDGVNSGQAAKVAPIRKMHGLRRTPVCHQRNAR